MVRTCQLIEISLKMRNRFLRHLRGGHSKGGVGGRRLKAPNSARSLYFTCSEMYASVISHQSKRKGIGYRPIQLPAHDETLHRQRTELEFGSYPYPVNSLSPCHTGLVYGAHLKYIIARRKNILALLTQESGKNILAVTLSSHLFSEVLIGFSGQMHFFPLIIYRPDRARGDKSVDLIDLVH